MKKMDKYGEYQGELIELKDFIDQANGYFDHLRINTSLLTNIYLNLGVEKITLEVEDDYFDTVFIEYDFNKITKLELKYLMIDVCNLQADEIEETNFGIIRLWWAE